MVRELLRGDHSYSELRAALPMLSDKVLSDRLAQLAEAGVVERDRRPGWPPRVRYVLTPRDAASAPSSRPCGTGERKRQHETSGLRVAVRRALLTDRPA
ncbi:winged helix-turn-helix transcriptional regulator [Streptomyces albogriseolus]|uniref:winged helix-turn-helix transcriptional regulator n=1 Tax=Streptomyces albogriseolus TaxID=1887 RepID=UPI0036D0B8D0